MLKELRSELEIFLKIIGNSLLNERLKVVFRSNII